MGLVYVLKGWSGPEYYKIGSTIHSNLNKRYPCRTMTRKSLVMTITTDKPRQIERELHAMFKAKRNGRTDAFALTEADFERIKAYAIACGSPYWNFPRKPQTATEAFAKENSAHGNQS